MSSYWLCITTNDNWNVIKSKRIWAVKKGDQKQLEKLAIGDLLVFYIKQIVENDTITGPQIKGVFRVDSAPFHDSTRSFAGSPHERFTHRVNIEPIAISQEGVDFKEIVPRLAFIKNKQKWFLYLQHGMRLISKNDFDLLSSSLESTR